MSTGVAAPPRDLQEDWWDSAELAVPSDVERKPGAKAEVSRRSAVAVLEDALDLAIEAGLTDWEKRRAIDALITRQVFPSVEVAQAEVLALLDQWEAETGRLGSMHAAKRGASYKKLLDLDSAVVIRAALTRLEQGASPHLLMLLEEIAGAAPAATETTVAGAARAWIDWGNRQGLI